MDDIIESNITEYAEVDPTGRYGRKNEVLSKGPLETAYRAFDEYDGIEVAWIEVKLLDSFEKAEKFERLQYEMNSLKALNHQNIAKFHTSWGDPPHQTIKIITEIFTSGTLRQFRQKHRRVSIKAVKNWCRQILEGLVYLHKRSPIVLHKDLKCDNIFVNGNHGEVKIGNIGLSEIIQKPNYMETCNELEDVYAFGMCVVELYTGIQTHKHAVKAEALGRINDPEVRNFVGKCLAELPRRLSAEELLNDPFLLLDGSDVASASSDSTRRDVLGSGYLNCYNFDDEVDDGFDGEVGIKGKRTEGGSVFLRLRIVDKRGKIRSIQFLFEVENDTALTVATEMVAELDMDHDVVKIADLIDREVASLVPGWVSHRGTDTDTDTESSAWCLEQGKESCCDCYGCDDAMEREEKEALRNMRWMRGLHRLEMRKLEDGKCVDYDIGSFCERAMRWIHRPTSLPVHALGLMSIHKICHLYTTP